ncbi:MAG TPA: ABC transporter permease [Chloroflexi bacterium]|nr:ABC transporter permease [Chloroflexota bacterium]
MNTTSTTVNKSHAQNGIRIPLNRRRARTYGVVFILIGAAIYLLFARTAESGQTSVFVLASGRSASIALPDWSLPTATILYVLSLFSVFVGGWQWARGFRRTNLMLGVVAGAFIFAFLVWASQGKSLNLTGLLGSALLRSVPIALAALSGVLCERCAVINIGIEGMMLVGAFFATLMGSLAANIWGWPTWLSLTFGLLSAIVVGGLLGLFLAVMAIRFRVDQIVAGTAINILGTGLTSFLSARILAEFQELNNPGLFSKVPLPLLSRIPVLGPVFFEQNILVYLLFVLLFVIHMMLFYTRWGLRTRAVGEHPRAADTLGVNVFKIRYINVMLGGMVGGLAGAFLTLGSVGRFDELMTAGKGFIGLAAMIFGNWMPFGAFGAALIFGFADALQTKLAIMEVPIPSQFLLMAPYLVTMIALAGVVGEVAAPAADGQPYEKQ